MMVVRVCLCGVLEGRGSYGACLATARRVLPCWSAGHGEWWQRQVEDAIATARGPTDLQARLQHLHELLKQPYDEIDRFSPPIVFGLCFCLVMFAQGVTRLAVVPVPDCSVDPECWRGIVGYAGAVLNAGIGFFFFFLFLFYLGSVGDAFDRTKRALNSPKARWQTSVRPGAVRCPVS